MILKRVVIGYRIIRTRQRTDHRFRKLNYQSNCCWICKTWIPYSIPQWQRKLC